MYGDPELHMYNSESLFVDSKVRHLNKKTNTIQFNIMFNTAEDIVGANRANTKFGFSELHWQEGLCWILEHQNDVCCVASLISKCVHHSHMIIWMFFRSHSQIL